jgi:hypothetical protein
VELIARMRNHGEIPPATVIQAVTSFPGLSSLRS